MRNASAVLAFAAMATLLAGCGGGGDATPPGAVGASPPLSIVVLGDSIAAGEGINYGYTYDYHPDINRLSRWTGGTDNPQWQGNYQLCHDSVYAYGDVLAASTGATLAKFACTGSTYDNGLVFDRRYAGVLYRPAQFGNWLAGTNLNADYDAATPDVVIVTFGADDVSFADIATYCATGYTAADAAEVQAIMASPDRSRALRAAFRRRFPTLEAWQARRTATTSSYCVEGSPGTPILTLFWDPVQSGKIAGNYQNLVAAIKARGQKAGKVPKIIFTTYHQPLPSHSQADDCYDLGDFSRAEIDYLISLENTLEQTLISALTGVEGVTIVDISTATQGHEFCTADPWTYGLSVLVENDDSLAPFHPTPKGQAAIAALIAPQIPSR
jgi:lysophospholipase L1-like esterase